MLDVYGYSDVNVRGKRKKTRGASRNTSNKKGSRAFVFYLKIVGKLLALCGIIFIGGYTWPYIEKKVNQPIARVKVQGKFAALKEQHVQKTIEPFLEQRFFSLKIKKLQLTLEKLPWVETVVIRRLWPDQLAVHIIEQIPVARWNQRSLLNANGESFTPEDVNGFEGLPHLVGPKGTQLEMMKQYHSISQQLRPLKLSIVSLQQSERGSWTLKVNGLKILLGRDDLLEKMQRFALIYKAELQTQKQRIKSVDVRYSNGVAVAWREQRG
ncbi:cell division protein FtsQ/DivIB [Zooshikella harenae]|uniref:Cell division protein FtsQ n=1 Tax=Zooshikella harenae TaxID=2827238 RepID=A0ABS5Z859_9GAMM|nr:cell division protein FtsQ/DivIB [Zooshikella harenae]MBU2710231.1 cell division protein FtsQ/DivIB [Zooshikella harenae]